MLGLGALASGSMAVKDPDGFAIYNVHTQVSIAFVRLIALQAGAFELNVVVITKVINTDNLMPVG